jgi:hypothetical protein
VYVHHLDIKLDVYSASLCDGQSEFGNEEFVGGFKEAFLLTSKNLNSSLLKANSLSVSIPAASSESTSLELRVELAAWARALLSISLWSACGCRLGGRLFEKYMMRYIVFCRLTETVDFALIRFKVDNATLTYLQSSGDDLRGKGKVLAKVNNTLVSKVVIVVLPVKGLSAKSL